MVNYNESLLFYLLRIGLGTESKYDFEFTEKPDWKFIFKMSSEQGVLAIVFDGLEYLINNNLIAEDMLPSHALKMQWAMNVMKIENVYDHQYSLANELADIYAKEGIKTVVLKGIASAVLYPKPNHRPCGDLDCFLMGDYEKGNKIAEENGAEVECDYYKHSHITYKGFMIENHQFCTPIKGPKKNKVFELKLQQVLKDNDIKSINGTNLLSPCPLFNALFLTIHSWRHFLDESIGLRHICDWIVLLTHYNKEIDWKRFIDIVNARDKKMLLFAKCISNIAHKYMGAPLPEAFKDAKETDELSESVLQIVLYGLRKDPLNEKNTVVRKLLRLRKFLNGDWKLGNFSEDNRFIIIYNRLIGYFTEKNPHL